MENKNKTIANELVDIIVRQRFEIDELKKTKDQNDYSVDEHHYDLVFLLAYLVEDADFESYLYQGVSKGAITIDQLESFKSIMEEL